MNRTPKTIWPERAPEAPPCLPRPNGVGGELHIIYSSIVVG
jgi:hypothetical protein